MTLCLFCTLVSCGGGEQTEQPGTGTGTADSGAALTMGERIAEDFKKKVGDDPDITAEALAGALLEGDAVDFNGAVMPMEPGYFMGLDLDTVTGFAEAARFSPMIGSIPFMGYVFRLDKDADAAAFMTILREHADLGWNICTFADRLIVENAGDWVLMLMCREAEED